MDVEEPFQARRRGPHGSAVNHSALPHNHPVNILYRIGVIGGSLYALHELKVFHKIVMSPDVDHEWFKIGLAATIAISAIKAYMELYEGKIRKQKIDYQNFKNSTHAVLFLFLLAAISFHMSLWGAYGGGKTILINILFGYGVLLQFMLLVPTWVQNIVTFIALTFFLQQYQ